MKSKVRWCYDYELLARDQKRDLFMFATGVFPLMLHSGQIELEVDEIVIMVAGEIIERIHFDEISSIYLGYDDLYPARLTKNFGTFWSPLKLTYAHGTQIYLVIGYNGLWTKDKAWFENIRNLLSDENGG